MLISIIIPLISILMTNTNTKIDNNNTIISIIVASIMNTLTEAFTTENDNLLLPIHFSVLLVSLLVIHHKY